MANKDYPHALQIACYRHYERQTPGVLRENEQVFEFEFDVTPALRDAAVKALRKSIYPSLGVDWRQSSERWETPRVFVVGPVDE